MKTLPGTVKYLWGAAVALVCGIIAFSCAETQKGGAAKKVETAKDGVEIHPGAVISQSDQTAMNNILRHYDKSLYKIQTYKNGKLESSRGGLSNIFIDKTLTSEIAQQAEKGFSYYVVQIFSLDKTHRDWDASLTYFASKTHATPAPPPPPPPRPTPAGSPSAESPAGLPQLTHIHPHVESQSEEVLKRLKPILDKYN